MSAACWRNAGGVLAAGQNDRGLPQPSSRGLGSTVTSESYAFKFRKPVR